MEVNAATIPVRSKQQLDEVVVTPTSCSDGPSTESGCGSKKNAELLVKKPVDNGPKPCRRCKVNGGMISMRGQPTCGDCFIPFVRLKAVKRLNTLHRDLADARGSKAPQQGKYLAGLSFGASSAGMLEMLADNIQYLVDRRKGGIAYSVEAVHVDTSLDRRAKEDTEKLLQEYRVRFPKLKFVRVGLEDVLDVPSVNWKVLGVREAKDVEGEDAAVEDKRRRVREMLEGLPSVSARMDILQLLVRHVLFARAAETGADVVVLGTNMTGLAEVTFSEVAKGRGISVPWVTQDGAFPLPSYVGEAPTANVKVGTKDIPVYHLMRDIFRNEVVTFASLTSPPITPLIPSLSQEALAASEKVVSHKTLSIEEVMGRFFAELEADHSSVIANVVRTTTKLRRLGKEGDGDDAAWCEVCGLALDDAGDERWRGEIGLEEEELDKGLCYGCQRSLTT